MYKIKTPKKLIETALPLDDINQAAAREKSIHQGHPSALHLWWARRPLAAARAVIFAQMVNDPGYERQYGRGFNKEKAIHERDRLFGIMRRLVAWENTNNQEVLEEAKHEIWKSWRETCELNKEHPQAPELFNPEKLPDFHDPFAGGGTLPLEAQRLGMIAYASDLNPVAVMINKAMVEIPPKFYGKSPLGPIPKGEVCPIKSWHGAAGLAEDVRRYGIWMREEAKKRIGHLYPQIEITRKMISERPDLKFYEGKKLTIIAWLWARTVKSPNPAFSDVHVPLISNYILCNKAGKTVYIEPQITGNNYNFVVKIGNPPKGFENGTKTTKANFKCLLSAVPITPDYIRQQGLSGNIGAKLMAVVLEGKRQRIYISPDENLEQLANSIEIDNVWRPMNTMPDNPRWFSPPLYGLKIYGSLYTSRQLVALNTFSDMIQQVIMRCEDDAKKIGLDDDCKGIEDGGKGARAYAEAIGIYLSLSISRLSNRCSSLNFWDRQGEKIQQVFGRQAIPMVWDFAESNPLSSSSGNFLGQISYLTKTLIESCSTGEKGLVYQFDAKRQNISYNKVISTDPPYYDNIGYADLSDYFYVWLRRNLQDLFPTLFATISTPKDDELVATPFRHGGKEHAEIFFLEGMTEAMHRLAELSHPAFPVTIYYAFKQSETDEKGTGNTGWETFIEAVIKAGFSITGTWPMRTELTRNLKKNINALASSIVLVCRKRSNDAATINRREFLRELESVMLESYNDMTHGGVNSPVAPVDLSQAIIGPGMAVFSKYKAVLEADGTPMTVKTALRLINRTFAGDDTFDSDTQFCLSWFEQNFWARGSFGDADVLSRAKGTSVGGLHEAGVIESGGGFVRLLRWQEYPDNWDPEKDNRNPIWESLHHLIRVLNTNGETETAKLLKRLDKQRGNIRMLAYRLYTLCERNNRAEEARIYNEFVVAWSSIEQIMVSLPSNKRKKIVEGSLI